MQQGLLQGILVPLDVHGSVRGPAELHAPPSAVGIEKDPEIAHRLGEIEALGGILGHAKLVQDGVQHPLQALKLGPDHLDVAALALLHVAARRLAQRIPEKLEIENDRMERRPHVVGRGRRQP